MKNKSAVLVALGLVMLGLTASLHASVGVRGAKGVTALFGSVTPVLASKGPVTVYSVIIGTGAATDYVALFDSGSVSGIVAPTQGSGGFKMRIAASSTTQNTQVTFDPPLQFVNGLVAANISTTMFSLTTYENGRITQGY